MEGAATTASIEVLTKNLINFLGEEFSLTRNLDKDAQRLKTSLAMIQSYLNDANKNLFAQDAVKTLLKQLEDVAFDADNVLDELNYHFLCKKVNKLKPLKHQVLSFFSSFDRISRPSKMAHKIKDINTNLDCIIKRAAELGLINIVVNAPAADAAATAATAAAADATTTANAAATAAAAFETSSFTTDPIFIGRDDDLPILVDALTNKSKEENFSILAIVGMVGMGGMGKTTLTRKVFSHPRIKDQFGSLVWVHVSQTFDAMILFKKILASLTPQIDRNLQQSLKADKVGSREFLKMLQEASRKANDVESKEVVLKKLQEALKAKTCLLVLDDVWNENTRIWGDFINSLSGVTSIKGNGIIVTTRNAGVASTVNPILTHQLDPLSNEECWSIIKEMSFKNGEVPSGFEIIGREIANRCQGLPLAANIVGGVLQSKLENKWLSVQQNWLPDEEVDTISKLLRLSFDNLSSPLLKKCFAYCSMFPKGHRIVKQELIELWMAEGFLRPDHINDMEFTGIKFLNVLLNNSLLLNAPRYIYRHEEYCVMHDLVHNFACSILGSKLDGNINSDGISRVRYVSHEHDKEELIPIPKEVARYLRTFSFYGETSGTMFSDFESLHALTLGYGCKVLPSSIRKLIHLRSLNISMTRIKYLPDWIGALHHLQSLRADTIYLRKLPSTLKYLINLRHLYIGNDVELPAEIGKLTSLQTLTHFTVGEKEGYKIEELGNLNNLKGELVIRDLEKVPDKEEAVKANIFQKPNLSSLRFEWESDREGDERNDESVLEGLQPHPNLKKLTIVEFDGKRFPLWTMKMVGLNKLTKITLLNCKECEELPALGHLPNLKSLWIYVD